MTRVLVTGGAGFLGQYLVANLAREGCEVAVLDLKPSAHPVLDIAPLCRRVSYGIDITRPDTLRGQFEGVELVYHLAGLVSFWRGHAKLLNEVNVGGTRHVLDEARRAGVGRFVHVSSVAAIGYNNDPNTPIDEAFSFDWSRVPHKHYMLSKHLAEEEVRQVYAEGLPALIVNPGLMWGPGDMLNSCKLIQGIKRGKIPACPPDGTNIVDVRDVANGLVGLRERGKPGERYILGGRNLTFREVYDTIAAQLGVPSPRWTLSPLFKPFLFYGCLLNEIIRRQPPELTADNVDSSFMVRYFSSAKAERELGWKTCNSFPDTIRDAVDWLRAHGKLGTS